MSNIFIIIITITTTIICFISAIIRCTVSNEWVLFPIPFDVFHLLKAGMTRKTIVRCLNAGNYLNWFTNSLLLNLDQPSLIILDNAKYRKSKKAGTLIASKFKKAEVINEVSEIESTAQVIFHL